MAILVVWECLNIEMLRNTVLKNYCHKEYFNAKI